MSGNVITFPSNQSPPEDDGEIMVVITVFESGKTTAWLSDEVETDEQRDWVKSNVFDGIYSLGDMIIDRDSLTSGRRNLDD